MSTASIIVIGVFSVILTTMVGYLVIGPMIKGRKSNKESV